MLTILRTVALATFILSSFGGSAFAQVVLPNEKVAVEANVVRNVLDLELLEFEETGIEGAVNFRLSEQAAVGIKGYYAIDAEVDYDSAIGGGSDDLDANSYSLGIGIRIGW